VQSTLLAGGKSKKKEQKKKMEIQEIQLARGQADP
jgi:hypothetical protein